MSLKILGMVEVLDALAEMKSDSVWNAAADAVNDAAKDVQKAVVAEAPVGPTGNLKDSIEAGNFKKRQGQPIGGFVRVNRNKAPHAHLVEFGARGGAMPANAFFARGVAKSQAAAFQKVEDGIKDAIDKIW